MFSVAELNLAVLGKDFLERYAFLINTKRRCLTLAETSSYTKGKESHIAFSNLIQTPQISTAKNRGFTRGISEPNQTEASAFQHAQWVSHTINTEDAPVFVRP